MYTVKSGDTLYSISMKYKVPLALLLRVNPYVDVYNLQAGETICVPVKGNDTCCGNPYGGTFRSWQGEQQMNTENEGQMGNPMEERNTEMGQLRNRMEEGNTEMGQLRNRMEERNTEMEQPGSCMQGKNTEMEQMEERMDRAGEDFWEQTREAGMERRRDESMENMAENERNRQTREYITREGDTLEKILGVESIPLMEGITLHFTGSQPVNSSGIALYRQK